MPVTLTQNPTDIQLNDQNEIDQILGNPPSWLLRWGISLVFVAVIIFGTLAWFIKYPDIIVAPVQILTENPAIRIMPLASGKLEALLVENQQPVKKGALLAVIESPVSRIDMLFLEEIIAIIDHCKQPKDYLKLSLSENLSLGSLQNQYASLVQQIKDYQHFLKQKTTISKIWTLEDQIEHTFSLNKTLKKQQKHLAKEVKIAYKNFQRNKKLKQQGVISDLDLEQIEIAYLQYQRQLDNFESQRINNQIQVEQLQSQIIDLRQNRADGTSSKALGIRETLQNLKSQIEIWKQNYLVTAPINGKISFADIWSENQFVQANKELFTIVPAEGAGKIIAKAKLPLANSGKVKIGQIVNIQLNSFPYQEYGILKSSVAKIALVPQEEHYIIELAMPEILLTTYDKTIPFTQEMQGMANIITEDKRILQRIFEQVLSLLKNH